MKLNLGCGPKPIAGYIGVDIAPQAEMVVDLRQPWPWGESTVDSVLAFDVFEHLPDRIHTMNELWRVLKPGRLALIEVPSATHGAGQWQDPTHVSQWCMNSFKYYEDGGRTREELGGPFYGIRARFKVERLSEKEQQDYRETVWKVRAVLRAVK